MNTIEVNREARDWKTFVFGDQADKIRAVFPYLKESLDVGFTERENRSIKVNAALLFDNDGIWLARIPFYGWSEPEVKEAVAKLRSELVSSQLYSVLVWSLDSHDSSDEIISLIEVMDIEGGQPLRHEEVDLIILVHRPYEDERLYMLQKEYERTMADELNRFMVSQEPSPLRVSVVLVREFNGRSGDAWLDVFSSNEEWAITAPFINAMCLCEADGIAFRDAEHVDRVLCMETLEHRNRLSDIIHPRDEEWLMNKYNTHIMCADLLTAERIGQLLKGRRETRLFDVHVIQTPHVNLEIKQSPHTLLPGQLRQGKVLAWLNDERSTGITVTHYEYRDLDDDEDEDDVHVIDQEEKEDVAEEKRTEVENDE